MGGISAPSTPYVLPDPLYADLVPRQDSTLAVLMATVDGQGEFAFANDAPVLVWLRSIANGGPLAFTSFPAGAYDYGNNSLTLENWSPTGALTISPGAGFPVGIFGGDGDFDSAGGDITIIGGTNDFPGNGGGSLSVLAGRNNNSPGLSGIATFGVSGSPTISSAVDDNGLGMLSFFDVGYTIRPVITGAKGGNAALTSLLAALSAFGLVDDQTT